MKKLKIIIPVLLVIVAIAVACFVLFSDKLAFTGRSQAEKGLSKSLNLFEDFEDVFVGNEEYKYLKNITSKPFETEVSFNVELDIDGLEDLLGNKDTAELVNKVLDELADANIITKVAMDKSKKQMLTNIEVDAENIVGKITGEAVVTEDEIAFRSKEINKNYLSISKEDAEENENAKQIFDMIQGLFDKDYSSYAFTKEEIEHFKNTYGDIFDKTVEDDMIKKEKGNFTVDGDSKSCTVTTISLNNEKVKELLKNYMETYKNDEKGQEILNKKLIAIYGEEITEQMIDEINETLDDLSDEIEDIEGWSIEFITYGNMVNVFGNEYKITIDEETLDIVERFNSDSREYIISFDEEELVNTTVKQTKNELTVNSKVDIDGITANVDLVKNKDKVSLKISAENIGEIEIVANIDTKTNTDKEFNQNIKLEITVSSKDLNGTATITMNEKVNIVDSIDVPDTSKAVNIFDNKFEKYIEDSQQPILELLQKIQKSDLYKAIQDYSTSSRTYNYNDYNLDNHTKEDVVDSKTLKKEIETWYKDLDIDEEETKTEAIEEEMISSLDFDEYVNVNTYISWKEGDTADKGYLGIEVVDMDDNSYEFYVDLSNDKVYSEDDVVFDTESVEWNEY